MTLYDDLGVAPDADEAAIKAAYRPRSQAMTRRALYQSAAPCALELSLSVDIAAPAGAPAVRPMIPFDLPEPGVLVRVKGFSTLRDGAYTVASVDGVDITLTAACKRGNKLEIDT